MQSSDWQFIIPDIGQTSREVSRWLRTISSFRTFTVTKEVLPPAVLVVSVTFEESVNLDLDLLRGSAQLYLGVHDLLSIPDEPPELVESDISNQSEVSS